MMLAVYRAVVGHHLRPSAATAGLETRLAEALVKTAERVERLARSLAPPGEARS